VDLPTSDFGMSMVSQPHTGVSAGKNDASRTYLAALRLTDSDGRTCTAPAPVLANPGDGNDHTYIPLPDRHRDRHSGGFHRPRLGGGTWWR